MYGRAAARRTSSPARLKQLQVYRDECVVIYRRCLSDAAAQQQISILCIYMVLNFI
jgi:hypothetical protein